MFDDLLGKLLEKRGIKDFDELRLDERETYLEMLRQQEHTQLTIEDLKRYIKKIRMSVEIELTKPSLEREQDIFLRARLLNYILLEAFLETPERAKEVLQQYMGAEAIK